MLVRTRPFHNNCPIHCQRMLPLHTNIVSISIGSSAGGMPDIMYYTSHRYYSGIIGCISEIVLGGELKLSLDPETLGTAHNVEPGLY